MIANNYHRKYSWKAALLQGPYAAIDAYQNANWCTTGPRILVARHAGKHPHRQHYYLDWLAREFPAIRGLFELHLLPCKVRDWSRYCLYLPWFQDPAVDWMSPAAYARALELEAECAQRKIPVINSVQATTNCIRSMAAEKLASAGIRTPRVVSITNPQRFLRDLAGLSLPFILRDDRGHGKSVQLIKDTTELDTIRFDHMRHPVAVEWVDVAASDGTFHKCRFVVAGDVGVRRHRIVSRHWEVRAEKRVGTEATKQSELEFLMAEATEHLLLDHARRCLNLQWAAFDYSFDPQGDLVVWETNSYPRLSFPRAPEHAYTHPYVERSLAAMTHMYLTAASLPVPEEIVRRMNLHTATSTATGHAPNHQAAA